MALDRRPVHREPVHGKAALAQRPEHEILDRMLLAAQRAEADELLRESDLLDEAGLDRGDDVVAKGGIEGHAGAIVRDGPPPHPIARAGTSPAGRRTQPSSKDEVVSPLRGSRGASRPRTVRPVSCKSPVQAPSRPASRSIRAASSNLPPAACTHASVSR